MNISIDLPDSLKSQVESYAERQGMSEDATIRRAIEQLVEQEKNVCWGTWIDNLTADTTLTNFESYRSELREPRQEIF